MLIGLMGKKTAGKSTAADYAVANGFVKIGFKDALYDEVKKNFPDLIEEIQKIYPEEDIFVTKPPLARRLLQNYGVEVRRGDDENYWINQWVQKVLTQDNDNVVVDDVRFKNEEEVIRRMGGRIIQIHREGVVLDKHISELEMELIKPDFIIHNDGSLEELWLSTQDAINACSNTGKML